MTWVRESGFIFAMIGSAVGFANILVFSAQCYKNGGGAFLIPFMAAILIIGLPMLYLEGIIGKLYGLPITSAYGLVNKEWKIFGWISALSCLTIGAFYSVLTSWSVSYTYFAATNQIPNDSAHFFQKEFLRDSGSLLSFNGVSWGVLISTILVLFISWLVTVKNIGEGVEKICSIFLPMLFGLIVTFTIIVAFLPGAMIGFERYLAPDFSKLKDFRLWRDVFGHVFFSFSLGIGIVVGYSRHTKKDTNIKRAMAMVALGDVAISVISGFAIFGCVGYMSHKTGISFQEIVKSDSTFEMGFIIFPQILKTFSIYLQPIIGSIFFFCVFIAGITGVFSIIESVAGNIEVEFDLNRKQAVSISVFLILILSIFFCMGNGTHILGAMSPMVLGYSFLIGGIAQIVAFVYLEKNVSQDPIFLSCSNKPKISYLCIKYFGLAFLIISLLGAISEELKETFGPVHVVRWGWFLLVLILSMWASSRKTSAA
jgi:NSS family neurotransmitter:Na+ symporter